MMMCEVFCYFIFGMYFYFFNPGTSSTPAINNPYKHKEKKEKIIKKK